MGDGGVGGTGGFGADPTSGQLGMLGLSEGDVSPGQGAPGTTGAAGPGDFAGFGGGGTSMDTIAPISTGGETKGGESPKVEELKKAVPKRTRRRTLLTDEEGGLEPVPIYRRSILGS